MQNFIVLAIFRRSNFENIQFISLCFIILNLQNGNLTIESGIVLAEGEEESYKINEVVSYLQGQEEVATVITNTSSDLYLNNDYQLSLFIATQNFGLI